MTRKQLDARKIRRKCCKIGENKNKHSSQHTIVVSTNTSNNYSVSGTEGLYDFRKKKSRKYYQYQHGNRKDHLVRTIKKQQKKISKTVLYLLVSDGEYSILGPTLISLMSCCVGVSMGTLLSMAPWMALAQRMASFSILV